ncbi:50S ribosomal protein L32 [Patescibacteria group bacterium]|nr:50S ribosomal protein L32 [Candidatus Falkowbacteria bacterium]MBU3906116.1 50S ribosomal protein L32 [Patescibacteria group bacterium]MCG2697850.1 50S ribosomal protein L32 [Candidatus Parcubacteria bacterium]MBU4014701.1 50S ribosomal protein L32 [Patescibacteria group bacterium]MBU4025982.1 50S ribosomal protein L32 [Patescibacteria group bacterium]
MSVPKKRRTKSSVGQRRSHHALKKISLNKCPKCGQAVKPHCACAFCGFYKGKEVLKIKSKSKSKKKELQ